jgi:hypothetical protein
MAGVLQSPDGLLELQNRNGFEHPVNAVFSRRVIGSGLAIEPAAHRRPLRGRQVPREGGHRAMATLAAAEQEGKNDGQHRGLLVAQPVNVAAFGQQPMHRFPKAQQLVALHLARGHTVEFFQASNRVAESATTRAAIRTAALPRWTNTAPSRTRSTWNVRPAGSWNGPGRSGRTA